MASPTAWRCEFPDFFGDQSLVYALDSNGAGGVLYGNHGQAKLSAVRGPDVISFIEPLLTGSAHTTSISVETGAAIYSRHTFRTVEKKFEPAQIRGACRRLE